MRPTVPLIELVCAECGKTFTRKNADHRRRLKEGATLFFCSNQCSGTYFSRKRLETGNNPLNKYNEIRKKKEPIQKQKILVRCSLCGKEFYKELRYVNQSKKRGSTKHFCTTDCSLVYARTEREKTIVRGEKPEHLIGYVKESDDYAPFRVFMKKIKNKRRREKEITVTLQYLKEQWERQGGIDPYTGQPLLLPKSTTDNSLSGNWMCASIDRIDSSKGYVPGNIEFVSMMANFAKNSWSKEDVIEFCKKVGAYHT